jgi:hypothetical protein
VELVQQVVDGTGYTRWCRSSKCTNELVEGVSTPRDKSSRIAVDLELSVKVRDKC